VTDRKKRIASFEEIVDRLLGVLPELEQSGLRLPGPTSTGAASDPDVTNALPLVHEVQANHVSAPPGPAGVHLSEPPAGASPPAAFTSPYQADAWGDRTNLSVVRPPPMMLFVGLGAMIAVLAVAITWIVARSIPPPIAPAAAVLPIPDEVPAAAQAANPSAPPVTTSFELPDPPVVPIDSLPVASGRPQGPYVPPPGKGFGRVILVASPGWCVVTIDGQPRGPTPLPPLNLPVGLHTVTCTPPGGKVHSMTISSYEGNATRYKFTLSDAP
jgi:hypothetical protein